MLGLGFATLTPTRGDAALRVSGRDVDVAGLTVDAGARSSRVLVKVDGRRAALQDIFFRIGGPHAGRAEVSLQVDGDGALLDDLWIWRADHGTGVGWTQNTAATGLVVRGDDVTATGLFVEHYQKYQVIWSGRRGRVVFFQSELPYDPPSQAAWKADRHTDGYAAFLVTQSGRGFDGAGMGVYSFFNQGVDIFADTAVQVPSNGAAHVHDVLTIFLDAANGKGGIRNVVNDVGGSSTIANPDVPVTVVDYP